MRRILQLAVVVAATAAGAGLIGSPAIAQEQEAEDPFGEGGVVQDDSGAVDLEARDGYVPTGGSGTGGGGSSCSESSGLQVQVADDFATPVTAGMVFLDPVLDAGVIDAFYFRSSAGLDSGTRLFSETGQWFLYNCGGSFYFLPEGGPAVSIAGLVQEAVGRLDPPDPPLAITPNHGKHIVQMPSWFAIDPNYWYQIRTEPASAGRVQVTATMTPYEIEWDPGNGETLPPCTNPGTVWTAGLDEDQNQCPYTYLRPSINPPDNTFELTGTIRFEVTHTTNAPGTYGPWLPVERTTTETIEVLEIQAIGR